MAEISIVLTQMIVFGVFLFFGYAARKSGKITEDGARSFSWLLVTILAPGQIIGTVLNLEDRPDMGKVALVFAVGLILYVALVLLGHLISRLLHVRKGDRRYYQTMAVFSNTGFLGIPLSIAVFGGQAALYLAILTIPFTILIYTYGYVLMRGKDKETASLPLREIINPGFLSAIVTLVILIFDIRLPVVFGEMTRYIGNCVSFLSLFVVGMNLVRVDLKKVFTDTRMYLFVLIRQIIFPILTLLILKHLIRDPMILGAFAIFVSVPVATMTSVIAAKNDADVDIVTRGVVFTTLASIGTIVLVFAIAL